ncbi:hypothetical protein OH77DRAFT_1520181 [Trametes cingulata]|nr:hypothetical protein OH77DRAFT_1520181 [Trametes cingulata]
MLPDFIQDISAIKDFVLTILSVGGYALILTGSGLITFDYLQDALNKEARVKTIVSQWRRVVSNLTEQQSCRIDRDALSRMADALDDAERRLHILAIRRRKSSICDRMWGGCVQDLNNLYNLVKQLDDDLRTSTDDALFRKTDSAACLLAPTDNANDAQLALRTATGCDGRHDRTSAKWWQMLSLWVLWRVIRRPVSTPGADCAIV